MSENITAILFDTTSIQQYVFGSNKLKDNLGASFIVEHLFDDFENDPGYEIEIGFIGGGNALIFIDSGDAKKFIRTCTAKWLQQFPGLSVAVAQMDGFVPNDPDYKKKIKHLFRTLADNKGRYHPVNTIPSHGITDVCRFTSLSAEAIELHSDHVYLISSATKTKRYYESIAREFESSILTSDILKKFEFPDEFDDLGQKKGEDSHIAVVHIDGNGFGEVFRSLNSLDDVKTLSNEVKSSIISAFVFALENYVHHIDKFAQFVKDNKDTKSSKPLFPIRPIVLGGDDITFVCHGKLGVWFAEKFMGKFNSFKMFGKDDLPYSSCAGVAIVKTKYPFYSAYLMAEELCRSAKQKRKESNSKGNWIDFQLAFSGLGNSLEETRYFQYSDLSETVMRIKRPYCMDAISDYSFLKLIESAQKLKDILPNSKIKDMREMLTRDEHSCVDFFEQLKMQHQKFKEEFFSDITTETALRDQPFFDMIEILEIYPFN